MASSHPIPPPLDANTVNALIREELDRNNKTLEFVQGQIERDRAFYKHLYTWAAGVIAVIAGLAVFVSYHSIDQMRADIKESVAAELESTKAQISALRAQAEATVNTELANVHSDVQKRVDTEFKSQNITSLVAKAAKEHTEKDLKGTINKAVEDQTKLAVRDAAPMIQEVARQASQLTAHNYLEPVQFKLERYGQLIDVDTLASLARAGDRKAFDSLDLVSRSIMSTTGAGSGYAIVSSEAKSVAAATVSAIKREIISGSHIKEKYQQPKTPEQITNILLNSRDINERMLALANLPDDPGTLPALVRVIANDENIAMVLIAVQLFNSRTHQRFDYTNKGADLMTFWSMNLTRFIKK